MVVEFVNYNPSFRVFRRRVQNLIILWNTYGFKMEHLKEVNIFLIEKEGERKLTFSTFVPQKVEKFPADTVGAIINQHENRINPFEEITLKIVLGKEEKIEGTLKVLPIAKPAEKEKGKRVQEVLLCALDEKTGKPCALYGEWKNEKFVLKCSLDDESTLQRDKNPLGNTKGD